MIPIARVISFLFHPIVFFLIMPFLVVYKQTGNSPYALKWQFFSLFFVILGILLLLVGRWRKIFSDFDLSQKNERTKFYFVMWLLAFSYLLIALLFKGMFFYLSLMASGIVFGIVLLAVVNHYVKASIHVAVACAFAITVFILFRNETPVSVFFIIPFMGWSRLVLKRHTIHEIISGGIIGTGITLLTFLLGKYVYTSS